MRLILRLQADPMTFDLQQTSLVYYQEVVNHLFDSAKGLFGGSSDVYGDFHDGTDSLNVNKTGTLKIATETSGVVTMVTQLVK